MNKIQSITIQIDQLFQDNRIYGGVLHSYFYECLVKGQLNKFYVDPHLKFDGKRLLIKLVNQLKQAN